MSGKVIDARSILNAFGVGNVSGASSLFAVRADANDRYLAASEARATPVPDTIAPNITPAVLQAFQSGDARAAERVAQALLAEYGGFTTANSAENRAAIMAALLWIGGTGVSYDDARREGSDKSTYSPNETLMRRSGVCRDTHTALAAVYSALASAQLVGGAWQLGAPNNDDARVFGFGSARENHGFMVYRDVDGTWNAIEYGRHYALRAETELGAFAALPHDAVEAKFYQLRGWDGKPVVADRILLDGARVHAFFRDDLGNRDAGDTFVRVTSAGLRAAVFLADGIALDTRLDLGASAVGAQAPQAGAGIRLTQHIDLGGPGESFRGYVHSSAGFYGSSISLSDTGARQRSDRQRITQLVIGLQSDGSVTHSPALWGEHLRLSYGLEWDVFASVALFSEMDNWRKSGMLGSFADATAHLGLGGAEQLGAGWSLSWALRYDHSVDFFALGMATKTSGADGLPATLGAERGELRYATRVDYEGASVRAAIELSGGVRFGELISAELRGSSTHALSATLGADDWQLGLLLRGQVDAAHTSPLDSVGVSVQANPFEEISVGASVEVPVDSRIAPFVSVKTDVRF